MKYQLQKLLRRMGSLAMLALMVLVLSLILQRANESGAAADAMAQGGAEGTAQTEPNPIVKISYKNDVCTLYFEKNDEGKWYWTGNAAFPLDSANVLNLVNSVKNLTVLTTQPITDELDAYGLDNPTATVRYTTLDGVQSTLKVGSRLEDGTYYMTDGESGEVHTISSAIYDHTRAGIIDMVVSEDMPDLTGCTVEAITLSSGGQSWRFRTQIDETNGERIWILNAQGIGSNEAASKLIACVPALSFEECIDYDPSEEALSVCGLDEPAAQLQVTYLDAEDTVQEYTLCVGNLRAQGETRFALLESSGAIYSISAQSVQPLMDAVSGALDQ
ncbi:MAG: DUF4340 domain-containing protein [Oscillospiraceae bacterium]|nr:DUF4340 domain-containing protein [Oscillospiraceae bacterium]